MVDRDTRADDSAATKRRAIPAAAYSTTMCRLTSGIVVADLHDLSEIYEAECNLVEWRRESPLGLKQLLESQQPIADFEHVARINIGAQFPSLLFNGLELHPCLQVLGRDIEFLVEAYATLFELKTVGVRIAATSAPPCPRFHVDNVGVRLVCTYMGAGTEWLDHAHVQRNLLGHRSAGLTDDESGLVRGRVEQLATFSVGLLKGEGWEGNAGRGVVHRSPAYGTQTRLVLTLDACG